MSLLHVSGEIKGPQFCGMRAKFVGGNIDVIYDLKFSSFAIFDPKNRVRSLGPNQHARIVYGINEPQIHRDVFLLYILTCMP